MRRILALALACMLLMAPAVASAKTIGGYTSKVDYSNTDPDRYRIEVDLTNQVISVYERADGQLVLQGLCTTGNAENPTGAGTFKLGHLKERFGYFVAFGQYAEYWTQVVRGIYIHSIMYDKKDLTTLSNSAYRGLGTALSHGCIRVLPEHAKWIFYNCPPGTECVITAKKPKDAALVAALKDAKPSKDRLYAAYDGKADPPIVLASVKAGEAPLRTGFSSSRDTTVATLRYGDPVKLLQIGPDWCKAETAKGKLGYVKTAYLHFDPDSAENRLTYRYTAKDDTALYASASTKATQLAAIPKGAAIDVIAVRDRYWYTAVVDGQFGFVRSRYTEATAYGSYPALPSIGGTGGTTTAGDDTAAGSATNEGMKVRIKQGILANYRSGPSTAYPILGTVAAGTEITLLEAHGSWYRADLNGIEGYISTVCIEF